MPIYEYRCAPCQMSIDVWNPISDRDAPTSCPGCGRFLTRALSGVALGKQARVGLGRAAYPQTWQDVDGGHPEALAYWRRRVNREQEEEARHPELRSLRRQNALDLRRLRQRD